MALNKVSIVLITTDMVILLAVYWDKELNVYETTLH